MQESQQQPSILKQLSPKRIIWPILIGLAVVTILFIRGFDKQAFLNVDWSWNFLFWIFIAFVCMVVRDLAYIYRIRLLTNGQLSWNQSLQVILLWEFGSAATPSSVGGTTLAIFLLAKEGISPGRSTAIVMLSVFLDELFFISIIPVFFLLLGKVALIPDESAIVGVTSEGLLNGLLIWFIVAFTIIFGYTIILAYGLFFNPLGMKRLLYRLFSLRFLKRWQKGAIRAGTDIIIASEEIKGQKIGYWIQAYIATMISWTGRFLVINCILVAIVGGLDHFLIFVRQVMMWIIMSVSPTPGGSGVAELSFATFLADIIPLENKGLEATLSLLWRMISYYPYLFIGVFLLPRWVRRVFTKKK